jgi:hypothetical protein
MNRFVYMIALTGLVLPAQAQPSQTHPGMPTSVAMRDMGMAGPIHQAVVTAFILPELQSELSLSAQQVTQFRQMKQEMLAKAKAESTRIAAKQKELDALLVPGTSKGEVVKKLLEQIAILRAQQAYLGYETATRMKAALTETQRTQLAAMNPHEFHQAMMSRMTMNDMLQMMEFMGGEGIMMRRMMMGGIIGQDMMGRNGPPPKR